MKNESVSKEECRYRRIELTAFVIITLASAFALLDAVASSIH